MHDGEQIHKQKLQLKRIHLKGCSEGCGRKMSQMIH